MIASGEAVAPENRQRAALPQTSFSTKSKRYEDSMKTSEMKS